METEQDPTTIEALRILEVVEDILRTSYTSPTHTPDDWAQIAGVSRKILDEFFEPVAMVKRDIIGEEGWTKLGELYALCNEMEGKDAEEDGAAG